HLRTGDCPPGIAACLTQDELAGRRRRQTRQLSFLLGAAILVGIMMARPSITAAQMIDNITFKNGVPGDYRGYSLASFTFVGNGIGGGAGDGYVAAGSKTDL